MTSASAAAIRTLLAHRVAGILLATSGGYERCDVPVVFFGERIMRRVPIKLVHGVSAAIFLGLGIIAIVS